MKKKIINAYVQLLGAVGALIAVYTFFQDPITKSVLLFYVAVICMFLFVVYYITFFLWRKLKKLIKVSKYGSILSLINESFFEVRKIIRELQNYHKENVDVTIVNPSEQNTHKTLSVESEKSSKIVCYKLSQAFSIITSSNCHASIKVLVQSEDSLPLEVVSLCCSSKEWEYNNNVKHWLHSNTDFLDIFENVGTEKGRFFMCNDLTKIVGYQNTSFQNYNEGNSTTSVGTWPLPYKSTIVAPISLDYSPDIIGFLCIDSPEVDAFNKDYDIDLITGVESGLYEMIMNYILLLNLSIEQDNIN